MRDILFRAKSGKNWVYGSLMYCYSEGDNKKSLSIQSDIVDETTGDLEQFLVIPETVGQFTGLNDIEGNKIFEGDECQFRKGIYIVFFVDGSFMVKSKKCKSDIWELHKFSIKMHRLKVIGIVHDKEYSA